MIDHKCFSLVDLLHRLHCMVGYSYVISVDKHGRMDGCSFPVAVLWVRKISSTAPGTIGRISAASTFQGRVASTARRWAPAEVRPDLRRRLKL